MLVTLSDSRQRKHGCQSPRHFPDARREQPPPPRGGFSLGLGGLVVVHNVIIPVPAFAGVWNTGLLLLIRLLLLVPY